MFAHFARRLTAFERSAPWCSWSSDGREFHAKIEVAGPIWGCETGVACSITGGCQQTSHPSKTQPCLITFMIWTWEPAFEYIIAHSRFLHRKYLVCAIGSRSLRFFGCLLSSQNQPALSCNLAESPCQSVRVNEVGRSEQSRRSCASADKESLTTRERRIPARSVTWAWAITNIACNPLLLSFDDPLLRMLHFITSYVYFFLAPQLEVLDIFRWCHTETTRSCRLLIVYVIVYIVYNVYIVCMYNIYIYVNNMFSIYKI